MHELLAWVATPTQLQLMKDGMLVRAFSYGRIDLDIAVARLAEHRTLHEERLVRYRELRGKTVASPKVKRSGRPRRGARRPSR
jgi:hypothetical protein